MHKVTLSYKLHLVTIIDSSQATNRDASYNATLTVMIAYVTNRNRVLVIGEVPNLAIAPVYG